MLGETIRLNYWRWTKCRSTKCRETSRRGTTSFSFQGGTDERRRRRQRRLLKVVQSMMTHARRSNSNRNPVFISEFQFQSTTSIICSAISFPSTNLI